MTDGRELLEFVIQDSFTPSTLPMARLAEYLADLAAVLGEREHVHFVELREGSAAVVHAVDREAIPKVRAHVRAVRAGEAEPEAMNAQTRIDQRLRADNAHAVLRPLGDDRSRLLAFPGATAELAPEYGPFSEQGQLQGTPISVGGKKALANVNIEDGERTYYCEASREVAIQIAPLLFNHRIRVFGTGRYFRSSSGAWEMRSFRVSHFEKLDARPLSETVEGLRSVTRRLGLDRSIMSKLADLRDA